METLRLGQAFFIFTENKAHMHHLPRLSTGEQSFEELRKKNCIYVDKTQFIERLLFIEQQKFIFFPRPRRFGKSLLVSTLKELFSGRKDLFAGLYIEDKIEWEEYPVIHLDFSRMHFRTQGLEQAISNRLDEIAAAYDVQFKHAGIDSKFNDLMQKLHEKTGKQVVILIDEYDKPITDVLEVGENKKAYEHREILRTFYSVVKGSSAHIRLFFLTGIARFSKVSLFSDLNNLTDLSKNKYYHNFLGYTQEELLQYFPEHLNFIAQEKNISLEELLVQVKEWYNGFSWNGRDTLYNPYSILSFLTAGEFQNFWFESGTPKFLIELLKKEEVYDLSGIEVSALEAENLDIQHVNFVPLFFQTGYLTVSKIDEFGDYILDYPNKEVRESMFRHILSGFSENPRSMSVPTSLLRALKTNSLDTITDIFNTLFASIPYQVFDRHQEKYFHAIFFLTFKLCGYHITSEVSTSTGRIDALLQIDNKVYIFEFKLNEPADVAMQQIHERGYYKQFLGQGKEVYLIGISFSGATKSIAEMKTEKLS
jgi:hypothetical protein